MALRSNPPTPLVVVAAPPTTEPVRHNRKTGRATAMPHAIAAFVGPNGSGKSLAVMLMAVVPAWEAGRLVVSNMPLYPEALGFPRSLYQPVESWRDLARIGVCPGHGACERWMVEPGQCAEGDCPSSSTRGRGCLLVLDEASAALPSRSSSSLPAQLLRVMNQLRKRDVQLVWTAPAWGRMDVAIRECTQSVTVCAGLLPDKWVRDQKPGQPAWFPKRARDEHGRPQAVERGWRPNRLFRFVTYDSTAYDEFTLGRADKMRPLRSRSYYRQRHDDQFGYGTLDQVSLLDHLTDSGACMDCGRRKRQTSCTCGDASAAPAAAKPTTGTPSGRPTGRKRATA